MGEEAKVENVVSSAIEVPRAALLRLCQRSLGSECLWSSAVSQVCQNLESYSAVIQNDQNDCLSVKMNKPHTRCVSLVSHLSVK